MLKIENNLEFLKKFSLDKKINTNIVKKPMQHIELLRSHSHYYYYILHIFLTVIRSVQVLKVVSLG